MNIPSTESFVTNIVAERSAPVSSTPSPRRLPSKGPRRTSALTAALVLAAFLTSTLVHPADATSVDGAAASSEAADLAGPRSSIDLNVYEAPAGDFALYSQSPFYSVLFKNRTKSESTVQFSDPEGRTVGFSPVSVQGINALGVSASEVEAERSQNKVAFAGAFGSGTNLEFETTYNGVKETITVEQRPSTSEDLAFRSQIFFNSNDMRLESEKGPVSDADLIDGALFLRTADGETSFVLPRPFVVDSPRMIFDAWRNADVAGSREHFSYLSYKVRMDEGSVFLDVVLPAAIHQNQSWTYPLFVDPSIQTQVSTNVLVENEVFVQLNSVTVMSGGTLTIRNCTMIWNASYELAVDPGGELVIENSTLTGNLSTDKYTVAIGGNTTILNSTINNTDSGVHVSASGRFWMFNSEVKNSAASGLVFLAPPANFSVHSNRIHANAQAGIEIIAGPSNVLLLVDENEVYDNWIGIKLLNSPQQNKLVGLDVHDNDGYGVYCNNSALWLNQTLVTNNPTGIYGDECNMTLKAVRVQASPVAIQLIHSVAMLDEVYLGGSASWDLDAALSNVTAIEGNWPEWSISTGTSNFEVQVRVNIRVLGAEGVPMVGVNVSIKNVTESLEFGPAPTDGYGWLRDVQLRYFVMQPGYDFTFFSPHLITVLTEPTHSIHYFVGGRSTVIIYATGDADNDGILDVTEDVPQDAWWFEAEAMSRWLRSEAYEFGASNDHVLAHSNGTYFRPLGWPKQEPGAYQFGFSARSYTEGVLLNLTVTDWDGNVVVSNTTYWVTRARNWYWGPEFTLDSAKTLRYQLSDLDATPPGTIAIDRAVIIRTREDGGSRTSALPGQFTDALATDSDSDFGNDSLEVRAQVYPLEAELFGINAEDIALCSASGGRCANHVNGSSLILAGNLTDLEYTAGHEYEVWIRARKVVGDEAGVNVTLQSGTSNVSSTISMSQEFQWYRGPSASYTASDTVVVTVADNDDPDVSGGPDWIQVDALFLADTSAYPNETIFALSNPLMPDTDFDELEDGSEINGFFMADIIQGLNHTAAAGISETPKGIFLNNSNSYARFDLDARTQGIYKVYIPVKFGASEAVGGAPLYTTMSSLFEMSLNDSFGNPVPLFDGEFGVFDYAPDPYWEGEYQQFATSFSFIWDLPVGTYDLRVYVNDSAATTLSNSQVMFTALLESIFVERFRLNALDTDSEDDNVTDGIEVRHAMMPLRDDSDYDLLSDWEEYFVGNDGYLTNPVFNDTDRDGLTDGLEEGLTPDLNPFTTTDPTNQDTDGDGLPDGWVDGWFADLRKYDWDKPGGFPDGIRQPFEGEDLNLDGAVGGGPFDYEVPSFASIGGETDPAVFDTDADGMDDGWELFYWGANETTLFVLDPLSNDSDVDQDLLDVTGTGANGDGTGDNLTNLQEYSVRSSPFSADIDHDFLEDGTEQKVAYRTSVTEGAHDSERFKNITLADWIFWDANPYDQTVGAFYNFSHTVTDGAWSSSFNSNWTERLTLLRDGALLTRNSTLDQVYLWFHIADTDDADLDGVLEGTVAVFYRINGSLEPTSNVPNTTFARREIAGGLKWNNPDSDGDGLKDGFEGWPLNGTEPFNEWWADVDLDGPINALDPDSDNDGLPDGLEWRNGDKDFDPAEGETHAFEADTDGDLIPDGNDTLPLDYDNDYLTGYPQHGTPNGTINAFGGVEAAWNMTDPSDRDTDGDELLDGLEDANRNAVLDDGETSPLDLDSDDDGLWDGPAVWDPLLTIRRGVPDGDVVLHNVETIDGDHFSFLFRPWYLHDDGLEVLNVSLSARAYVLTANLSAWAESNNTTFDISVFLGGMPQFTAYPLINKTGTNWTSFVLGHVVSSSATSQTIWITSKAGKFFLKNITLVGGDLGEEAFGSGPTASDSDADGLQDGFEVSLRTNSITLDSEVSGGSFPLKATNSSRFTSDNDSFRSDPTLTDTDGDNLWDGYFVGQYLGQQTQLGEKAYGTDPSARDTDGDGLQDGLEILTLGSSPTDQDTDADGLPDSYEPFPTMDFDNDTKVNVLDNDSDLPSSVSLLDRDSREYIGGTDYYLSVVFRTNATGGDFTEPRIWVAAAVNATGDLTAYTFEKFETTLPAAATRLEFATTLGGPPGTQVGGRQGAVTFEGWPIYTSTQLGTWKLHVMLPNWTVVTFTQQNNTAGMYLDRGLTWSNADSSNYRFRESINWSAVLGVDADNDGLVNELEGAFGTSITDADTDDDGLSDGTEYYWQDGRLDGTNTDTDEDGLGDGYEVSTTGSSPRFNDTDRDGLWDGNFSWFAGHSVNRTVGEFVNRTDVRDPDSDGDGMPDGWELYYYLNASDAGDAFSDNDLDWADAWEEYTWNLTENYSFFTHGVAWTGTDPTDLDTDNDTMPDGYETYWGLDPRNVSDADIHSDGDLIKNKDEYNWSIVNASWDTPHAAWYVWLTLDPFSNDTDGDTLSDGFEMNRSIRDYDGDQEANGVDIDSDNDELWDDEEVMGWNVSILPAWILRVNTTEFLNETGDINWSKFPLWANTSDPYDADTDNDTLTDGQEFWNGSNPRNNDTDEDRILDADDWTTDENNSEVSLRAVQDMEGPEIDVNGWTFGACSDKSLGDCANISMTLRDSGSGVYTIEVQHLGSGWSRGINIPAMMAIAGQASEGPLGSKPYWMEVPISGWHDRMGMFKVAITATDGMLNENSTIYVGGQIFEFAKSWAVTMSSGTGDDPWSVGYNAGVIFAGYSAGLDSVSFFDEILSGRLNATTMLAGFANLPHVVTHTGEAYDNAYLDYMATLAMAVNPYVPSAEDLSNLADVNTTYWMRDTGAKLENASPWLQFAIRFWQGSVDAGILTTAVIAVAGAAAGGQASAAAMTGLSTLKAFPQVAKLLIGLRKILGAALNLVRGIIDSVKATKAFKAVFMAGAKMWVAMKGSIEEVGDAAHRFAVAAWKAPGALKDRLLQAFKKNPEGFAKLLCIGVVVACSVATLEPTGFTSILLAWVRVSAKGVQVSIEEALDIAEVSAKWAATSSGSRAASIAYHFHKWGKGRTLAQYTDDALNFWQKHGAKAVWKHFDQPWQPSFYIKAEGQVGHFTAKGEIITYRGFP